jgi:hypothetical protein
VLCDTYADIDSERKDIPEKVFPLILRNFFGVPQALYSEVLRKNNSCGYDRARERPPSGLVDTSDEFKTFCPEGIIMLVYIHSMEAMRKIPFLLSWRLCPSFL